MHIKNKFIIPFFLSVVFITFSSSCEKEDAGDGTVPEITVLGFNPIYWAADTPYEDPGAIAIDITATGDTLVISDRIIVTNMVDVSTPGDYYVLYDVTDESGVRALQKSRDVKVVVGK